MLQGPEMRVVTPQAPSPGQQLVIDYGDKSNEELLFHYGVQDTPPAPPPPPPPPSVVLNSCMQGLRQPTQQSMHVQGA